MVHFNAIGGITTLDGLSDTDLTGKADDYGIFYNSVTGKWGAKANFAKIGNDVSGGTSGSILYVDASGDLAQDNSNLFWDDANNRLGIGTNSPGSPLTINGSSNQIAIQLSGTERFKANVGASVFDFSTLPDSTAASSVRFFRLTNTSGDVAVKFLSPDGTGTTTEAQIGIGALDTWFATQGGRVGIGTNSPGQLLDVDGIAQVRQSLYVGEDTVTDGLISLRSSGSITNDAQIYTDSGGSLFLKSFASGSDIEFLSVGSGASVTTSLFLDNGGNAGFRNSSPEDLLHLGNNTLTSEKGIVLETSFAKWNITAGTAGALNIKDNGTDRLKIDSAGDVSILNNLTVTGDASVDGMTITTHGQANSIFIGKDSGNASLTAINSTAIGEDTLKSLTSGDNNTAIGGFALDAAQDASFNTAIGTGALGSNVSGFGNVAIGSNALLLSTDSNNFAIGVSALRFSTTGGNNLALGNYALYNLTTGVGNIAFGRNSGYVNQTGNYNAYIGYLAGRYGGTADTGNTAIGYGACGGFSAATGGNENTCIGYLAGGKVAGSGNVFIGYRAGQDETGSNKFYVENSTSSSPLIYGEFDNDYLKINGELEVTGDFYVNTDTLYVDVSLNRVGINDPTPDAALGVNLTNSGAGDHGIQLAGTGSGYGLNVAPTLDTGGSNTQAIRAVPTIIVNEARTSAYVLNNNMNLDGTSGATLTNLFGQYLRFTGKSGSNVNVTNGYLLKLANNSGSGMMMTNLSGLDINNLTGGSANNWGIRSLMTSGSGKWFIYDSGGADSYFSGNVGFGTDSPISNLHVDGSVATKVTTLTSTSLTLDTTHHVILADDDTAGSTITVTLPAASGNSGLQYVIKKIGSTANVTIDGNGSETIDRSTTQTLSLQDEVMKFICDGSDWHII